MKKLSDERLEQMLSAYCEAVTVLLYYKTPFPPIPFLHFLHNFLRLFYSAHIFPFWK